MSLDEIIERNKVIAEFEGHKINWGFNKKSVLFLGTVINEDMLRYHNSFDWLIPVVVRIKDANNENLLSYIDEIDAVFCTDLTIEKLHESVFNYIVNLKSLERR